MTAKALLAAAVVIALALSPSISECIEAHKEEQEHRWVIWAWIVLVILLALAFGEELFRGA